MELKLMRKILIVVGTRPNYMKISQFKKLQKSYPNCDVKIIHTGQHYDEKLAQVFFKELEIFPDHILDLKSRTPISQMAEIMVGVEKYITTAFKPDIVLVPGDVNSSVAAALAANKLEIPVGHIESGLRSNDLTMPEEHNRKIIDEIASVFFVTEPSGLSNLKVENKQGAIHHVGNTMIDTIVAFTEQIDKSPILQELEVKEGMYAILTLHRPANVDSKEGLLNLLSVISHVCKKIKVVLSIHPRTQEKFKTFDLENQLSQIKNLIVCPPLPYFSFQKLIKNCLFVLTDSGGIQEETTFYGVTCLTLRDNTERPSTIMEGSNVLIGTNPKNAIIEIDKMLNGDVKKGERPAFWDGQSTNRILKILSEFE
jgi:UDP-N-acetylglucosamine 2-epimerase (non-hydrolysing)